MKKPIAYAFAIFFLITACSLSQTVTFSMAQYGVSDIDTAIWRVNPDGDTITLSGTYAMDSLDRINFCNTCSLNIDFGLYMKEITNELGEGVPWSCSFVQGLDRFVIRAEFVEEITPPVYFSFTRDYIREEIQWSTPAHSSYFGPGGANMAQDSCNNFFLQFVPPTSNSVCGSIIIIVAVVAKVAGSLPSISDEKYIKIPVCVPCTTGIKESGYLLEHIAISVFPNPFNSKVEIRIQKTEVRR